MSTPLKLGDRVAYRAQFLRNIGDYSHARASIRGTLAAEGDWLATVVWDGDATPRHVHIGNLVDATRLHLEPA